MTDISGSRALRGKTPTPASPRVSARAYCGLRSDESAHRFLRAFMQWRQPCRFEEQRHQLIRALERELGRKEAATLMKLVPSIPWHGFATMRDLDHHGVLWRSEAARVEGSIERLEARTEAMINDAVHRLTFRLLPAMATMIAVFGAIAALV